MENKHRSYDINIFLDVFALGIGELNVHKIITMVITFITYLICLYILSIIKNQQNELREKDEILDNALTTIEHNKEMILQSYITAIEAKDKYTCGHSKTVAEYSKEIAVELGCSQEEIKLVYKAAYLHDLGKICVDQEILNKPGKLRPGELKEIKKHPSIGADIVKQLPGLKEYAVAIKHHHERYDGKGYPDGLSGNNIPFASRIISVADAFDAMTSERSYKKKMSYEEAVRELENSSGTQFDPHIVNIFLKVLHKKGTISKRIENLSQLYNSHAIMFYNSELNKKRHAEEIIASSLYNNYFVVVFFDKINRESLKTKFKKEVLMGQLVLLTSQDYIFINIRRNNRDEVLNEYYLNVLEKGYEGITIITDAFYVSKEVGLKSLLDLEQYVTELIGDKPIYAVCMYHDEMKGDSRANNLIYNHTHEIRDGRIIKIS